MPSCRYDSLFIRSLIRARMPPRAPRPGPRKAPQAPGHQHPRSRAGPRRRLRLGASPLRGVLQSMDGELPQPQAQGRGGSCRRDCGERASALACRLAVPREPRPLDVPGARREDASVPAAAWRARSLAAGRAGEGKSRPDNAPGPPGRTRSPRYFRFRPAHAVDEPASSQSGISIARATAVIRWSKLASATG